MNGVMMVLLRGRMLLIGLAAFLAGWPPAARPAGSVLENLTGLPAYPNLTGARMDKLLETETFGRWCSKFSAASSDSLATVEAWYRKTLRRASETDLANDGRYNYRPRLTGIKLALGIDYVAVYRTSNEETTIELHRCNWNH
jgi:hypothetical protein